MSQHLIAPTHQRFEHYLPASIFQRTPQFAEGGIRRDKMQRLITVENLRASRSSVCIKLERKLGPKGAITRQPQDFKVQEVMLCDGNTWMFSSSLPTQPACIPVRAFFEGPACSSKWSSPTSHSFAILNTVDPIQNCRTNSIIYVQHNASEAVCTCCLLCCRNLQCILFNIHAC